MTERLQNILSKRGLASRRHAAALILDGRVTVNRQVVLEPGFRVTLPQDVVTLDGVIVPAVEERHRTILLNKPRGVICSASSEQGQTVCDLLRELPERLVPVGRLDKESEGLLLLSNDGELIDHMTHPRYGQSKRYEVLVAGRCDGETLRRLRAPMVLDGYTIRPCEIRLLKEENSPSALTTLEFTLHEGRNRQIRKMCREVGLRVVRLRRIAIGALTDFRLRPGQWRDLSPGELRLLKQEHYLSTSHQPTFNKD